MPFYKEVEIAQESCSIVSEGIVTVQNGCWVVWVFGFEVVKAKIWNNRSLGHGVQFRY